MRQCKIDHNAFTPLLPPDELLNELAASAPARDFVEKSRQQVKDILDGKDKRFMLIVGPCSIHDSVSAIDYAERLGQLKKKVEDEFFVLMRVYFEKPRTIHGWKGMLYDPDLTGVQDINKGIRQTRALLLKLAQIGMPSAAEFLDPAVPNYLADLISWGCIGARTAESQTHRQLASGLPLPIAFKNTTEGNIEIAVNGILSASFPHTYIGHDLQGRTCIKHTNGNPYCHIVLRGGAKKPNYDPACISQTSSALARANLPARILVDCAHDNSGRRHHAQIAVFQSILHQALEGNSSLKGLLIESNIRAGNQPITGDFSKLEYGVSVTDPCLDWETTEELILSGYRLKKKEKMEESKLSADYAFN